MGNPFGLDTPEIQAVCRVIEALMCSRFGVELRWVMRDFNTKQEYPEPIEYPGAPPGTPPIHGGPPVTTLDMSFVGCARAEGEVGEDLGPDMDAEPQETSELRNNLANTRAHVHELQEKLGESIRLYKAEQRKLAEFQDEEGQLIRRLAAKTKAKYGETEKESVQRFLEWFMDQFGVDIGDDRLKHLRIPEKSHRPGTTTERISPADIVDQFFDSFQKEPAGGILSPSEGGDKDAQ